MELISHRIRLGYDSPTHGWDAYTWRKICYNCVSVYGLRQDEVLWKQGLLWVFIELMIKSRSPPSRVIPGGKAAGPWRWPPTPIYRRGWRNSRAIHLLPLWAFVWPVLGWTLPLLFVVFEHEKCNLLLSPIHFASFHTVNKKVWLFMNNYDT